MGLSYREWLRSHPAGWSFLQGLPECGSHKKSSSKPLFVSFHFVPWKPFTIGFLGTSCYTNNNTMSFDLPKYSALLSPLSGFRAFFDFFWCPHPLEDTLRHCLWQWPLWPADARQVQPLRQDGLMYPAISWVRAFLVRKVFLFLTAKWAKNHMSICPKKCWPKVTQQQNIIIWKI